MNIALLEPNVQTYIEHHLKSDVAQLLLKGISFPNVTTSELVEQIEAKSRCEKKLPTWFETKDIYYPNKLNIEQTSSEATAKYKSQLISGNKIIDITGGFGIDAYFFSNSFSEVVHCEINTELSQIVAYNFKVLNKTNIKTLAQDGTNYLANNEDNFDWIYIDPSRRHDIKGKVFFLRDCLPDVPSHLQLLWSRSKNLLIKTSPLLDISSGMKELEFVKEIHVVAVNNEVKELLWILEFGFLGNTVIKTINIKGRITEEFQFGLQSEANSTSNFSPPLTYLYEPNAAVMKSGGFNSVSSVYELAKLHTHSHLYTSTQLMEFPGRIFKIEKAVPYNKKQLKKLNISKANITTRNFPESVENLRKQFKIKDGGSFYLFFTTDLNNDKIVLVCHKTEVICY